MTNHVILNFVFFFICSLHYICLGDSNNQTYGPSASIVRVSVHKVICALSNIMSKIRIFLWCPYKEVRTQDFSAQCYRQLSSLLLMQFVSAGKTTNHLWSLACIYTYRARELKDRNRKEF